MKKFIMFFIALASICCPAFSAEPFLGWGCNDVAAMESAMKKDTKDVWVSCKTVYALRLAEIKSKENVNTLEKCMAIVKKTYADNKHVGIDDSKVFSQVALYFVCRNDKSILNEIAASPLAKNDIIFQYHYIVVHKWVTVPPAEYKVAVYDCLKQAVKNGDTYNMFDIAFEKFLDVFLEDDSETVIKKLQVLYRLAVPQLSTNEKMKPIVVKISLALKGYGFDVK